MLFLFVSLNDISFCIFCGVMSVTVAVSVLTLWHLSSGLIEMAAKELTIFVYFYICFFSYSHSFIHNSMVKLI